MWERLHRFNALPRSAKLLFVRAVVLLSVIRASLRVRGFCATRRWLQSRVSSTTDPLVPEPAASEKDSAEVIRIVLAAARYSPIRSSCLERSLALWWLLARRGISSQLRIGARKDGGKFQAHAWVECNGVAVGEPAKTHLHYTAFDGEFSGELT